MALDEVAIPTSIKHQGVATVFPLFAPFINLLLSTNLSFMWRA
jgi:hypothetical protein